ncbi:hypothetical protein EXIGLDRAFT_829267 [Exidia glandulosa HHB12029]|uniref:Uncharacterized protein n=1 Tax=Exidia glandulosa HHB12029 TaxID=1314781 RepID=A0A165PM69_EXIGL|nr:hypothetical protein EXIGLDRAFT_829267 [Exidia glandulosa HHB12029]
MPYSTGHSPRVPIYTLPVELLLEVMKDVGDPVLVTAVCSHWRRFGLRAPRLWTTIRIRDEDGYTALATTQIFAARSATLALHIHRTGLLYGDKSESDAASLWILDALILSLLARCASFTYRYCSLSRGRTASFVLTVFSNSAPLLRSLRLTGKGDLRQLYDSNKPLATDWPVLKVLNLECCFPLGSLAVTSLERLRIYPASSCSRDCQNYNSFSPGLATVVGRNPLLRKLDVDCEGAGCRDEEAIHGARVGLGDVFPSHSRDVKLWSVNLAWVSAVPPVLRNLTKLILGGETTQPGVCEGEYGIHAVHAFSRFLSEVPNLERLSIGDWEYPVVVTPDDLSSLTRVPVTRLRELRLRRVDATWCKQILGAMIAPHLQDLHLEPDYDDETVGASNCQLFVPSSVLQWNFPQLKKLEIDFEEWTPPSYVGTEIPLLLRHGVLPSLRILFLGQYSTHGFISAPIAHSIAHVLSDCRIMPSLRKLQMPACDLRNDVARGSRGNVTDTLSWNSPYADREMGRLLNERRGADAESNVPPITVTILECDCRDLDSDSDSDVSSSS